jgi:hypothetical protein
MKPLKARYQINVTLDPEDARELERVIAARQISASRFARELVRACLAKERQHSTAQAVGGSAT